ncbi:peptidoglycan synthetase FtsI [Stackebrandtia albiflava]|uniref:Peptidoglycan synthetase FtsI n=1 Tax=Stackebrandtia albiflava TaxID=406432 RepID=A0A562VC19_9ACTN|nr:peptidoglycan synthetase FtsI [Stackebrandtia albiflava]
MRDAADDRRRRAATSRRSERDAFRPALRLVEGGAAKQSQSRTAAARERARRKVATATPAARIPAARNTRSRQAPRGPAARGNPTRRRVIKRRLPRIGDPHRRLRFATVAMLLIFVVTGGRLIQLQVTDAAAYAADALDQRLVEEVIPGSRGAILDRDGRLLAFSAEARYVFADPTKVEKHEETAELLTPLLGIPASELVDRMMPRTRSDGTDSEFEYLARGVDISVGDAIQELNLPGIHVAYDERREVPGHDLAANIIGFVGTDGEGLYGLEARCEGILKGVDGERRYEKSASGQRIPGGYYREEPAQPGDDLQLTIDSDLQYEVQRILADTVAAKDAEFGAAVVMDSATGEIVALASAPTYDAADPGDYEPEDRIDWATAAVVDPGSSHKALVVGAALEEGVIDADTQLTVAPYTHKGDVRFEDSHYHVERPMSIGGILAHSSNVGTIMLADELGAQTLYDYQLKFGLGSPTAIGMPAEAAGLVQPPENWSGSSYGSIPIGHGVAVTPLQMAAGYSAIANDGVYIQPTLIKGTVDAEGDLSPYQTPQTHRLFSTETAKDLQYLLQGPVAVPDGTGTAARLDDYLVAGKTGTGLLTKDNEYAPGEVANFVGFAPADEPRYTVAVFAYTPGGGGGAVTGEAFGDIMKFTLEHFRVPPSSEAPADITVFP